MRAAPQFTLAPNDLPETDLTERRIVSCLIVPGLHNSGPEHWQSRWENLRDDCTRVDLGYWDAPQRETWIARLDRSIAESPQPVVFAAHSLGCLAVALWAAQASDKHIRKVSGALLVAPPDVARPKASALLTEFAPAPDAPLNFPTTLVASRNDPYASFNRSMRLAAVWGSHFVDAGDAGHINAASGLGDWEPGQAHLDRLKYGSVLKIAERRGHIDRIDSVNGRVHTHRSPPRLEPAVRRSIPAFGSQSL